jgi:uncharacterized protein
MERKIEKRLLEWKNSVTKKPLIVQGARQVGKTFSILSFGKAHYRNMVYLNFESQPDLSRIFERDLDPERIIRELSVYTGSAIFERDTLLFFDEIQADQKALTSLKYFHEEAPGYDIIAAGSLLGVAVNRETRSFPVGKVDMITLYPLDFEEYLWAIGQDSAAAMIRECFSGDSFCGVHSALLDHFYHYLFTGGMPQVINEYLRSGDYTMVGVVQRSIHDAYLADMAKYATPTETVKIMAVYKSIPAQLARENHKFQYKLIKSGARSSIYELPVEWLAASGMVIKCPKITQGTFPLNAFTDHSAFKIYHSDTGLLCSAYAIPAIRMFVESGGVDSIKGTLAENYVAAALVFNGFTPGYWESDGRAEVDFLIQNDEGDVIPIEVKSSEHVRSKSLQQYVSRYNPKYSIRISTKNFGFENQIKSVPLYAAYCISRDYQ